MILNVENSYIFVETVILFQDSMNNKVKRVPVNHKNKRVCVCVCVCGVCVRVWAVCVCVLNAIPRSLYWAMYSPETPAFVFPTLK